MSSLSIYDCALNCIVDLLCLPVIEQALLSRVLVLLHSWLLEKAVTYIAGNPGLQQKAQAINTQDDLGNEHGIDDMIDRLTKGYLVPGVQAFRSRMPTGSVRTRLHQLPFDGRQVVKSNKNLQLQVCLSWQ